MLLQRPALVPWANQEANHKVLKWHSAAGGKKALDKRKCTQRGNALDTIVFLCLARLFMHESSFLLFLEICQSFQIFSLYWKQYLEQHTCASSPLQPKAFTNTPPLSRATSSCLHMGFREPTAFSVHLPSCPPIPWLLDLSALHTLISKPFHEHLLAH